MALSEEAKGTLGRSVSDTDPRLKRLESVNRLIPNPRVDLGELTGEQQYMFAVYKSLDASGILPCPATLALFDNYLELSPCVDRKRVKEYLQGLIGIERAGGASDLGPLGSAPSAPVEENRPGMISRFRSWWKGGSQ